jgi:hypothetical protein
MADLKLTVGMAVYKDFANLWSTLTALRMYHPEILELLDIVVVDNAPETPDGERSKDFVENWVAKQPGLGGARYFPFSEFNSTAAPRNHVFNVAESPNVLVMDSHVMVEPEALRRLIEWYDENPDTLDLYHGPLIYDDLRHTSTHFQDEWRSEMWGTWGTDERYQYERQVEVVKTASGEVSVQVQRTECEPFEIPGMGLGLFTCRRDAWLGFNPEFRGFGGEEMYIHTKYRQLGRKVWLLPWLRWAHQFGRPGGVPYPLSVEDKFRNYLIGLGELGLPLRPAVEHFEEKLGAVKVDQMLADRGTSRDKIDEGMAPVMLAGAARGAEGERVVDPQRDEMIRQMMQQMQVMQVDRDRLAEERDKAMEMLSQAQSAAADSHHRRTAP